jgi:hypothetical protein
MRASRVQWPLQKNLRLFSDSCGKALPMDAHAALDFVCQHGMVLASAKGRAPRLAEAIVGEAIRGSWWAHPQSHRIFTVFEALGTSPDILVCKLIEGKVTYVHRRLWPALLRVKELFPPENIARIDQEHTPSGRHVNHTTPLERWLDACCHTEARALSEAAALEALGPWALQYSQHRMER